MSLTIFACGAAAGGAVASANGAPMRAVASARASAPEAPPQLREEVQPSSRLTPGAIARRGLGFTVFVRGGGVYGAGALLDRDGHVLTCHHVVGDLARITVAFADGATFDARVVDSDPELDLALLQIAPGARPLPEPASIASVEPGDDLFALGAPRKLAFSLARGMASFVGRPFSGAYYLQSDLPMNAGSSGGPVLNDRGQLVAIASFVLRNSEGLAFALPIDYAYRRFRAKLALPEAMSAGMAAFERWLAELSPARNAAERGGHSVTPGSATVPTVARDQGE